MTRLALFAAALALPLAACQTATDAPDAPATTASATAPIDGFDGFGDAIADTASALPASTVTADADAYTGKTVTVSGTVAEVCQKAGCWATLVTDNGTIRINVAKENGTGPYVYTMPTDIAGRHVVATGYFEKTTTPADHVEHMAQESGTYDSTKTYTAAEELRLTATGVLVRKA